MFGVQAWKSVDPVTSLKGLTEAKKKLPVGTIKISSVHPKSKKKAQVRVFVQTDSELKYIGTLGATKGATKGAAEKFLKDAGVSLSDLPTGPKWTHTIDPDKEAKPPVTTVPKPKAEPEPKATELPEPKKVVTTEKQAKYNEKFGDAAHQHSLKLGPEAAKIRDDMMHGIETPPGGDANAVYHAWLSTHVGMNVNDLESDYGADWSEKAWAIAASVSKAKGGPGDEEWEADKKAKPPKPSAPDKEYKLKGFGETFKAIKAAGGHTAVDAKTAADYTLTHGSDWPESYKLAQIIDSSGGADKLAKMAATHASMAKSLKLTHGDDWQEKAKAIHKELYGNDAGELPEPAKPKAVVASPEAQSKEIEDPGLKAAKVKVKKPEVTASPPPPPTSGYTPPPGGSPTASLKVPSPKNLKKVGGAESLGGAGQKQFYQDKQGNKFLFKLATKKGTGKPHPMRAFVQSSFSEIAQEIKPAHPKIETVKLDGKVGAIYPFLPGGDPPSLQGQSPSDLSPSETWDVAEEHVIDWLTSQHDSHPGNFLRTEDGRIIGIDKEQGYKYFGDDKLSIDYHPNSKYGEQEPFYNTLWRDWSNGKVNFDPQKLGASIDKAMAIPPATFYKHLKPYAEARFPGDAVGQENFLRAAYNRKNTLKRDFEKFFSGLYEKKTGEKGEFTFAAGFLPASEKDKPYTEIKITPAKTETASEALSALGGKTTPYSSKSKGPDPTKITVKASGSEADFKAMLTKFGFGDASIKVGGNYKMVFLDKAAWEGAAKITTPEKKEEITIYPTKEIKPHSGQPTYFPEVGVHEKSLGNVSFLKKIKADTYLGHGGTRVTLDGPDVEQQVARVKRKKDEKGEYYEVHFKLRAPTWKKIKSGSPSTFFFNQGSYDPKTDTQTDEGTNYSGDAQKWSTKDGEVYLMGKDAGFAFQGSVMAKIRTGPEGINDALKGMLDSMKPGFSKKILRDPKPKEIESARLSSVLKAVSPQVADNVDQLEMGLQPFTSSSSGYYGSSMHGMMSSSEIQKLKDTWKAHGSKRTPELLRELLKGKISDEDLAKVAQVQMTPNHATFVQPGRWRTLGGGTEEKPKVRCVSWEAGKASNVVKMFEGVGALGIHERALAGDIKHGSSDTSDIGTGCADNMTMRLWTANQDHQSSSQGYGSYKLIIAPDQVDRLDPIYHPGDEYGSVNPNGGHGDAFKRRQTLDAQIAGGLSHGELVVRRAVAKDKILRVAAETEDQRKALIKAFRAKGMEELNGVPLEDFIVIAEDRGTLYQKYVKPAGY